MTLIAVENATTIYHSKRGHQVIAVDALNVRIPDDQPTLLTVVGESGSGKTTLARMLLGLTRPTTGRVVYRGQDIAKLGRVGRQHFYREVQPVFQDPYATYNPFYRIDRVLWSVVRRFRLAHSQAEGLAKIKNALRAVDLNPQDVLGRYPHQLSGGERQRAMLARVYLIRPRLIVADEPLSMVDASLRTLFLNILLDFYEQHAISCVHITHNLATAYYLGGHLMIMRQGRVVEEGDMDSVIANPTHPYTQALIAAVPNPDPTKRRQP